MLFRSRKNRLDDADFTPLIKSSLVRLDVPETGITNQRLAEIGKIETLISLDLAINPAIDDAGMKYLENLSKLRSLRLEGTRITDAGVESLTKLRALNYFNLSDCENLTDKSLESLANLRGLTDLRIPTNPQLTEPAVRKLQAALPKCRITSDYPAAAAVP